MNFWENKRVLVTGGTGFRAQVDFAEGLRRTVAWYLSTRPGEAGDR